MVWSRSAYSNEGSLWFIGDVTEGRNSWVNYGVYRAILSAQIHTDEAGLIGWCFTLHMDSDPKHTGVF